MAYNVFLFNGLGISVNALGSSSGLSGVQLATINLTLQSYFERVVRAHDAVSGLQPFGGAAVRWLAGLPEIAPNELLIYLMPFGTTIAKTGSVQVGQPPPGHDGFTNGNLGGGTASEVYLHFSDAVLLANLMFHEAMHNKLGLDNDMHKGDGLAASPVSAGTLLSEANVRDMAAKLDVNRPQWRAGIGLLVAESLRPNSDPAKGLF
jgi:hypothetical protein